MEGVIAREQIWKKLELLNIWQQQMVVALIDSLVEVQSAAARRDKNRLLSLSIWTEQDISAFISMAGEPLNHALVIALETGQRPGDLLTLPWSAYDGAWIRPVSKAIAAKFCSNTMAFDGARMRRSPTVPLATDSRRR